jgi:3-oxoadipate CoA-transferase beta subunit
LATLEITTQGLRLIDVVEGLSREELEKLVDLPIAV